MSSDPDIAKCFEFAKELTLQAGKILECFKDEKVVYHKGEWDFVTDCDHKIEKILIDGLSREFPDHKIIAEETVNAIGKMPELTDAPTWLLDPIDGTVNFMHSFPHFCISVALTVCKELVLGIIYNPSSTELYTAIKGKGAFLNGKPIRTSKVTELKKALLMIESVTKVQKNRDIYAARLDALDKATQIARNIGSAALSLAYVAQGSADCVHSDHVKVWDVAAGTLILREAGGTVLDTKGGVYDIMKPNTIAASNETLAREMSKLIIDTDLKTQRKRLKRT
ncbi:PREDICTED: inositol monophosphatase 3-like [Vollenhovia emeryi]|uniref:inositol monophosphatase 3-like n=1 Tax=Vollenhovia emeryi TaxID=411798 RepID=UPI0005F4BB20|nr:PREDICTED: inositol monophosphatase 3-like [Vollenhovia emeryi]XP_011868923.1 PREDICTED: inositol monophosphatase 3-like [Vollenhovia emeryi]XP_011868925.1 PREDICTED: inositol monophosphatase 3-like [Vollenhovia emeryi]XP_011868926.1 PREDICTED: inositol monophosphatase 3-like [Vollenhovia emeryi]